MGVKYGLDTFEVTDVLKRVEFGIREFFRPFIFSLEESVCACKLASVRRLKGRIQRKEERRLEGEKRGKGGRRDSTLL